MIWVTGADGQLGHELFHQLYEGKEHKTIFTTINDCDITNETAVRSLVEDNGIKIIINCAAYTLVDKAETDSKLAFNVNINGPLILAKVAKDFNITIIHISTDYVFPGDKPAPYTEDDIPKPISIYGLSKLNGEQAIQKYANKSVIIRTSWLYSQYGSNFVKTIVSKARAALEATAVSDATAAAAQSNNLSEKLLELGIVYDQVGNPTYAGDLVSAILRIVDLINNKDNFKIIYNYSNEGIASWYDFAKAIIDILNLNSNVKIRPILTTEYPTAAKRPSFSVLDKSKIKKELNIEIPHWRESLEKCLKENQL
ncbi:MAG: NAD(P)-dependent oxidoreductase [Oligoflexia bacterium]|nr:NAD(P)-dependent oxidoreductase [Oligoflexia bacterium]